MRKLYRTTREKLWKALFKPQEEWPAKEKDTGLGAEHPPLKVKLQSFIFRFGLFSKDSNLSFPGFRRSG